MQAVDGRDERRSGGSSGPEGGQVCAATIKRAWDDASAVTHREESPAVARRWRGSALVTGRWRRWVYELHLIGVLLMGLQMEEDRW
jgi:hypothetical protein